jgi:hypothetical protein
LLIQLLLVPVVLEPRHLFLAHLLLMLVAAAAVLMM